MKKTVHDQFILVKSKFVPELKKWIQTDELLSTIGFQQIEDQESENNFYVRFRILFDNESSKYSSSELQNCINNMCENLESTDISKSIDERKMFGVSSAAGDDSSYNSDYDGSEEPSHGHENLSRTVSDTLGQEFNEYVSLGQQNWALPDSCYQSKVEFALKLGYTEKFVQLALQKLGLNPEQNELLAELIRLGACQQSITKLNNIGDGCDSGEISSEFVLVGNEKSRLRPIVIDGSNVAMSHGNKEVFSCKGIKICVDWFQSRGHNEITVFVPKWRKEHSRPDNLIIDQEFLHELESKRILVFTPSREVGGKRIMCYDDRYILKLAADNDGIIVSNDNYRDLIQEYTEYRKIIEERILMYTFVNDRFMPPDDPLGRSGPTLDNFLKMTSPKKTDACPYGKKCTYGNKCKYNHPERGFGPQKSVTERLVENAQKQLHARKLDTATGKKLRGKSLSLPLQSSDDVQKMSNEATSDKQTLSRAKSTNSNYRFDLIPNGAMKVGGMPFSVSPGTSNVSYSPHQQHLSPFPYPHLYPMNHSSPEMTKFPPQNVEKNSTRNLHSKLQRQLSINPVCDPRVIQMQRRLVSSEISHQVPESSSCNFQGQNYLSAHPDVMRISSAPSTNLTRVMMNERAHSSTSEPHLLEAVKTPFASLSPSWSLHSQLNSSNNHIIPSVPMDDSRCKLHYHLASIFPEEQVDAVMRIYPNETNPQKICAAILSMFPPKP